MQPEVAKFLHDIQKACHRLERFTTGKTLTDYEVDELLQGAVERQFTIIGEALSQARKLDADLPRVITAFAGIIGFRNVLIHGYALIKHETVWSIIENDLAVLKKEVNDLLALAP